MGGRAGQSSVTSPGVATSRPGVLHHVATQDRNVSQAPGLTPHHKRGVTNTLLRIQCGQVLYRPCREHSLGGGCLHARDAVDGAAGRPTCSWWGMCVTARRSTCEGTWWQWWQGVKEDLGDHSAGIVDAAWVERQRPDSNMTTTARLATVTTSCEGAVVRGGGKGPGVRGMFGAVHWRHSRGQRSCGTRQWWGNQWASRRGG